MPATHSRFGPRSANGDVSVLNIVSDPPEETVYHYLEASPHNVNSVTVMVDEDGRTIKRSRIYDDGVIIEGKSDNIKFGTTEENEVSVVAGEVKARAALVQEVKFQQSDAFISAPEYNMELFVPDGKVIVTTAGGIECAGDVNLQDLYATNLYIGTAPTLRYRIAGNRGTSGQILTAGAAGATSWQDPLDLSILEDKTQNLSATTTLSTFSNEVKVNGQVTVNNTALNTSYSLPTVGPTLANSRLVSTNTTGTLKWVEPSYLRAYRVDASFLPNTINFTTAGQTLNLEGLMNINNVNGELKFTGTGTQYTGQTTRMYMATFSILLQGDTKGNSDFVLSMVNGANVIATRRLNIAENQLITNSITGAGAIGSGQTLSITLLSIDGNKTLKTGSPNFSIVIH